MKKNNILIITIILMAIGFATVATTLYINGLTKISGNEEAFDYDVIFTDGSLSDGGYVNVQPKMIKFNTADLKVLNQKSILTYTIANNSLQYDAKVEVSCKYDNDTLSEQDKSYISWINLLQDTITAGTTAEGTLTITLDNVSTTEKIFDITCTLNANAIERDSAVTSTRTVRLSNDINNNDIADIGDEIQIGNEYFYVISNNSGDIRMLAKYNLAYGESYSLKDEITSREDMTGFVEMYLGASEDFIQNSNFRGYIEGTKEVYGVIEYGNPIPSEVETALSQNNVTHVYKYDSSDTVIYPIVEQYVAFLNENYNIGATGGLMSFDDLVLLGYHMNDGANHESANEYPYSISDVAENYPWVLNTTYYTGEFGSDGSGTNGPFIVYNTGAPRNALDLLDGFAGIRPVLTINESVLN